MNVNKKLAAFLEITMQEAHDKQNKLNKEIEDIYDKACAEALSSAQSAMDLRLKEETLRAFTEKNNSITKRQAEIRKQVLDLRAELADCVFNGVVEKLRQFTRSSEYSEYLISSINNAKAKYGELEVFLTKEDMKYKKEIETKTGVTIIESDNDFIGGFKASLIGKNIWFDNTFRAKISEEKRNFNKLELDM